MSIRVDSRAKKMIIGREVHYIMIKGSVDQEDKTTLNMCAPHKYAKICEAKTDIMERRNRQIHN